MSLILRNNFKAHTNPQLTSGSSDFSDGDRVYTAIVSHGAVSVAITGFGGTVTENSNLANTKGFRIKCYDALTTTGVRFNPSTSDLNANDYFVLIYSDSPLQHHFAKITEVITEDEEGDAFEFEPKLGNEIPIDTKFIIFQITKNTDIIAISLGMKQDDSLGDSPDYLGELARRMVVARPLFYFYDGLDKEGELNHNTKYFAMRKCGTANSYTLTKTDPSRAFVTVQDFGKTVIDYSKYSHSVKLTDKLRDLDGTSSTTTNEGISYTQNFVDYDLCFKNARRIADDEINSAVYTGETRYLNYAFSPTKSNVMYNVYDHVNTESIEGKSGFAETSILDNGRIVPKKIKEFSSYRVRHNIHRADFDAFFPLKATYSSSTSAFVFSFNTEYDLGTVLNAGDEVKLGDKILIVKDDGSGNAVISALSGTTQTITFENHSSNPYSRGENDGVFTAQSVTPSSNEIPHRRAYNATDGTLMLDTHLLNGRFSKMYVAFTSLNHKERFATVTACDAVKNMITLSFTGDSYNSNPLSFTKGQYQLFIERFNGEIENIELKKEEGQSIVELKGRDKFNKLLSPIVNLDTLFSEDIIYSSNSPYNKVGNIKSGNTYTIALGDTEILTNIVDDASEFDNYPVVGTKVYGVNGYIGEVISVSLHASTKLKLIITPAITQLNSEALYIDIEKNYILNKALSSSHLANQKPTSLTGAANKGILFNAGNKINISNGTEEDILVLTSANGNEGAVGYDINNPSSILNDFAFQTKLKNEHGSVRNEDLTDSGGKANFDTVNTLIDFEVVSSVEGEKGTQIELAPYMPITLGRKAHFYEDVSELTFTTIGQVSAVASSSHGNLYFKMTTSQVYSLKKGDPLFSRSPSLEEKGFIGLVFNIIQISTTSVANTTYVQLDRSPKYLTVNDYIYSATKPTNELTLVNGAHLWGGKILTRPHPSFIQHNSKNRLVPLNVESTTVSGDYSSRFGQPYYKISGLSFGDFSLNQPKVDSTDGKTIRTTYPNRGTYNYLANVYNFKPNVGSSNVINAHTTTDSYRVFPLEERGLTGPYGSNFSDTRIHLSSDFSKPQLGITRQQTKAALTQPDESSARLFMYINSDILPYTSLREDSLLFASSGSMVKSLDNYELLLIENNKQKDSKSNGGERLLLKDNTFQRLHFSSSEDLSKLKRFGIMRLTEVCFDFFFNTLNPEKETIKIRDNANYAITTDLGQSTLVGTITSIVGDKITFSGSVSLSTNDYIYDSFGRYIGQISSGTPVSGNTYDLLSDGFLTNDGNAASTAYKHDNASVTIKGRNNKDTFARVDSSFHPLKCCIIGDLNYGGDSGDDAFELHNVGIAGGVAETAPTITSDTEIIGPVAFNADYIGNVNRNIGEFNVIQQMTMHTTNSVGTEPRAHNSIIGVVLDRFDIEDAGKYKAVAGNTSQVLLGNETNALLIGRTPPYRDYHAVITSDIPFKQIDKVGASTTTTTSSRPYIGDGAYMCFKPRLWIDSSTTVSGGGVVDGNYSVADITSSGGTLKKISIRLDRPSHANHKSIHNTFLKFIDLTGCYLVPEEGLNTEGSSFSVGTREARVGMNNVIPNKLIHVISHEVSNTDEDIHHLICSEAPSSLEALQGRGYRVLQPNDTCFYDFMPNEIKFNTLSSKYTKQPNKNQVYSMENSYFYKEGQDYTADGTSIRPADEGVLSMFVIVDTDKQSTDNNLVLSSTSNFFATNLPDGEYTMNFSDGEESKKVSFTSTTNNAYNSIKLSKRINRSGIVSVSETFTVTSNESLKIKPTRACIGTTVDVALEAEDLINELLEQEEIQFETTGTDTPVYLAPNYKGVDLYSAINYLLERKNMELIEESDLFKISHNNSDKFTNIIINDSGDYLISDFETQTTLFDFYNEIIVYGATHKATRKDIRSIQKRGRKTLEVVEGTLTTQGDVEKRATDLLRLHSTVNQKLSFTMQNKGINQLRVGDIVSVAIPRENIEMSEYMVLEMQHLLTGFIKLQLGRYTKNLSDMFSELLMANKSIKASLRNNNLLATEISFNFLNSLKTKELKLLVRKRQASGGRTLGFGAAFGFTTQLGFEGGATIVITNLVEEDLT